VVLLLILISALVRFVRLEEPAELVFDETYYAKDACLYLGTKPDACGLLQESEQSYVHPPLGKWLIAAGIKVFGFSSLGWRFMPALFGTALAVVVFLLARQLFNERWTAGVAGLLVATDFLMIVQSRIAMLDIFLAFFVVLGFLFMALDRNEVLRVRKYLMGDEADALPSYRPVYRYAAGVSLGLGLSVKWSALFSLMAAAGLAVSWWWGLRRLRRSGSTGVDGPSEPNREHRPARQTGSILVAFLVLPGLVYVTSYAGYFAEQLGESCPFRMSANNDKRFLGEGLLPYEEGVCVPGPLGVALSFADLHDRVADYHLTLKAKHPYQANAWTWPLVLRPIAYYYSSVGGKAREIIGIGNVLIWYGALIAAGWLLMRSRRSWQPERVVGVAWAAQYLPWVLVARPLFLFYMTPVVPFMMIALAASLSALRRRGRKSRRFVIGYLIVGVVLMTLVFYPVLTAMAVPYDLWLRLMWIRKFDCGAHPCGWI
jgi:dolichyl-phosphate-mannose-protein mannosyltransferase